MKTKIKSILPNTTLVLLQLAGRVLKQEDIFVKSSSYKNEDRLIAFGPYDGRYIIVVYTMRDNVHRIISARATRRKERENYEEAKGKNR